MMLRLAAVALAMTLAKPSGSTRYFRPNERRTLGRAGGVNRVRGMTPRQQRTVLGRAARNLGVRYTGWTIE